MSIAYEQQARRLYKAIRQLRSSSWTPVGVTGLELRSAMYLLLNNNDGSFKEDNPFWKAKCRTLLMRPAIEPIACSYWTCLKSFQLDRAVALKMASALAGKSLCYRTSEAIGRSIDGDVVFEPIERAGGWLDRLHIARQSPSLVNSMPMFTFATIIMAHPFSDGNGRFGRLLTHAALARCADTDCISIALGPAFYLHAKQLGQALDLLTTSGDWTAFNQAFLHMLDDAVMLTDKVIKGL